MRIQIELLQAPVQPVRYIQCKSRNPCMSVWRTLARSDPKGQRSVMQLCIFWVHCSLGVADEVLLTCA